MVRSLTAFKVISSGRRHPDLVAALLVLWEFHQHRDQGDQLKVSELWKLGLDLDQWQLLRVQLLEHKVIAVTQSDNYVLCRDLGHTSLRQLADIIAMPAQMPGVTDHLQIFPWFPAVGGRLHAIDQFVEEQFEVSIAELFAVEGEYHNPVNAGESKRPDIPEDELINPSSLTATADSIQNSALGIDNGDAKSDA